MKEHTKTKAETPLPCPKAIEHPANEASRGHNCSPTYGLTPFVRRNVLKGSVGSSLNVLLGFAVAAAIALGDQRASATAANLTLTENCDASIPFGTTTIHVNGTVTYAA